jgi:type VI secretion system secreted protein VgrG
MPKYSQAGRFLAVSTPLGKDALLLESCAGTEALSGLFEFTLGLLAEANAAVTDFSTLLGKSATVTIGGTGGVTRVINGMVARLSEGGQVRGAQGGTTFVRYQARLVPRVWLLSRQTRSRVFQQLSVPDILKQVLAGYDVTYGLSGTYEPRDFCTQYRETDFDFASRLMEEEGIYYYFKHADGSHTMALGDTPNGHVDLPGAADLIYESVGGGNRPEDRVFGWVKTQELRAGKVTLWDHTFEKPGDHLDAVKPTLDTVTAGTVTHKLKIGGTNDALDLYDYPGGYAQRFDGVAPGGGDQPAEVQKIFADNARTAAVRMQQEASAAVVVVGEGSCRQMTPGHKFTLARHFNADGAYVVVEVTHDATLDGVYTGEGGDGLAYHNGFRCVPLALPYRPARVTPKATVRGTQTATVVGPAGEEIFTDKYSRVKVLFPWDREGKGDQASSCWVRVASSWAGKQWGAISIPRVGQEVVVAYEEGDPDRPIVVGSVYNAEQMPPYTLPDNRTQSGLKTRSTTGGSAENFNELRFEDKKGHEQVYFHAERDFDRVVENNDTLKVGFQTKSAGDQTVGVFNNRSVTIGGGKSDAKDGSDTQSVWNTRTEIIGSGEAMAKDGSHLVTIYKDRTVTIKTGNETLTVDKGNRLTTISTGNDTLLIKLGNQETKIDLGKSTTEAMQSIELKVGSNSIKIDQTGITIKGLMVKIEGTATAEMAAPMAKVSGTGMLTLAGGITMIN